MDDEILPVGGRGCLACGPAGFFLKSLITLSMLLYVLNPQTNPSGEIPMVWFLGVLFVMKRSDTYPGKHSLQQMK
jgi:hypothetical protein